MSREADDLNAKVSEAIRRAEQLDDAGMDSRSAWTMVSSFEDRLAAVFPTSEPEGRIARRGAVRAALAAGDRERAESLTNRYSRERGAGNLPGALQRILAEAARAGAEA